MCFCDRQNALVVCDEAGRPAAAGERVRQREETDTGERGEREATAE